MIFRRGASWYIRVDGRKTVAKGCKTKREAELMEAELAARVGRQKLGLEPLTRNPDKHSVASLVSWHLGRAKRMKSAIEMKRTMTKHVVGDFAGLPLERVDRAAVNCWLDDREATGISGATVNRLRSYLMAAFTRAIAAGIYIGENPVKGTRKRTEERTAKRAMPADVVRLILDNAPNPSWALALKVAAFTGMRRGEIAKLSWRDVDLDAGIIYVRGTKAMRDRMVPIHSELLPVLKAAKHAQGVVIPRASWDHSSQIVHHILERVGRDDVDANFHSLRGAWASRWRACGAPRDMIEWVGWGPRHNSVMERHYLTYTAAELHAEMAKLTWPGGAASTDAVVIPMGVAR